MVLVRVKAKKQSNQILLKKKNQVLEARNLF